VNVALVGTARVLLTVGLTPAAGNAIYLSVTPGRASTTPSAVLLGVVKDASTYVLDQSVIAVVEIVDGGAAGVAGFGVVPTVAALRALAGSQLRPSTAYTLLGYYAAGDSSAGALIFDPTETDPDDGIFVFRPTSIDAGDPGRFVRLESGVFDARKGGLRCDGAALQYPTLVAVYAAVTARGGFTTMTIGPGVVDIGPGGNPLAPPVGNARAVGIAGLGAVTLKGRAHDEFTTSFGIASVLTDPLVSGYGPHDFTQDLSAAIPGAGVRTFVGVAAVGDFTVGDWVYVRLGADPTDETLWWGQMITQITAIDGDDITVSDQVPENIPLNTNDTREGNHHDLIRITHLCRGFEISDLTLDNVGIGASVALGTYCHDLHYAWSAFAFNHVYDIGTTSERITADTITGVDIPDRPHYGWFSNGWLHYGMRLRQIAIANLDGVNFIGTEGQSRGVSVADARVVADGTTAPAGQFISSSTACPVHFSDLVIQGRGTVYSDGLATYDNLAVQGAVDDTHSVSFQVGTRQLTGTVLLNDKLYRWIRSGPHMIIPLAPSETYTLPMPIEGLVRNIRIRVSTLTGITVFSQSSGPRSYDLLPDLIADQYVAPNPSVQASFLFPGGGWDDTNVQLNITTNGSVPADAYVEVETEFFVSDASLPTTPPLQIAGSGAPSANAAFAGQRYLDRTAMVFYTAVNVGNGPADWATG
jgi:hypothetical protein